MRSIINNISVNVFHKINLYYSNLYKKLQKRNKFDLIISNPPYIYTKKLFTLDFDIKFSECFIGLLEKDDHNNYYENVINKFQSFVKHNGVFVLELGANSKKYIKNIVHKYSSNIVCYRDLNDIYRVLIVLI